MKNDMVYFEELHKYFVPARLSASDRERRSFIRRSTAR